MNRRGGDLRGLWIGTAVLALAAAARPARAQPSKPPPAATPASDGALPGAVTPDIAFKPKAGGSLVSLNLEDADLAELVKAIGNITGKRFVLSPKLRSFKATVFAPEKVTVAEAYDAFLAILAGNGMTVVPHGRFLEIVEAQTAVQRPLPVLGPGAPVPAEERFVTRLYRPMHLGADEVAGVLDKLRSKDGQVLAAGSGLLVITDSGAIIRRMLEVMAEVDVEAAGQKVWVQPIHFAAAKDVASLIADLAGGDGSSRGGKAAGAPAPASPASAGRLRLLADERTNSLVVVGSDADYQRVLALLERIDVPRSSEGQMHTLPLQNASCKELSGTLSNLLGSGGAAAPGATKGGRAVTTDEVFEGPMRVTCDELSNKLVAVGSMRDFAELRRVVSDLDEPRRQVYIEAVILDVGVQRATDLGLGFHGGLPIEGGAMYGGSNAAQSVTGLPSRLEGLALGVKGPDLENTRGLVPGQSGLSIPAFGVVVHALAEDSRSNVLATPHVLATDNVKAEISIGENIPLQNNAGTPQLTSQGLPVSTAPATRQDVGTKITVTPHVNDSNLVRLEIAEEISSEGQRAGDLGAVSINQRRATTTLVVEDQQTVVIGGLVRDVALEAQSKIPVLGDIPLLGALFRQSTTTMQKSNLLLILTPYVVRNAEDLRAIFERKMQERQEFLDRHFVFRDDDDWSPPQDFRRTNGLLEGIRQSMREVDEQARVLEEARAKTPTTHAPTEPVDLPSTVRAPGPATTAVKSAEPAAAPARSDAAPNANPAPGRVKPKGLGRIE